MLQDRRKIRPSILLASLVGVLLAGWLIARPRSNPAPAAPPGQETASSLPAAEAVVSPTRQGDLLREEVRAESPQPAEVQETAVESGLTRSNSPINSQDLDQNRDWARDFPAEALAWLQSAPEGPQRDTVAEMACLQLSQTNPVAAVALAERCLSGTNGMLPNVLDNIALQWAGQDEQAAEAWALAQPQGEPQDRLLERVAYVKSQTNPEAAARLVAEQMLPGPAQTEAAISVMHQWALRDANAAMAWAEAFPPGDLRERAINEVKNISAHLSGGQTAF